VIAITLQHNVQLPQVLMGRFRHASRAAMKMRASFNQRRGHSSTSGAQDRQANKKGRPDGLRTVPILQHDPDRPEDVMTDSEDHAGDEWRYACMSRPWVPMKEAPKPENSSGYRPYRMDAQPGDWLTY
jgi:hypothetical protein